MNNLNYFSKIVFFLFILNIGISYSQEIVVPESESEPEIPFQIIEKIPEFEGCEGLKSNELRACFNEQIQNHIRKYLVYPDEAREQNIQGKVYVAFVIDFEGNVTKVKARGPSGASILEEEAMRIVNLLPQFKPGIQRGKPVNVSFSLPIRFKLDEPSKKKK
ncbi:energy transducer TonB [uncultured Flavobacterium sp.]|uniref:energy transducer TonB n=1 Tax=uncultured Flavobacterium sp. TaxID=165435 RepID=UPI0030ECCF41|tara:strand:+ start:214266 stop:214751 length:486 start_codon:yes stop_codon:yes gene_type:complete